MAEGKRHLWLGVAIPSIWLEATITHQRECVCHAVQASKGCRVSKRGQEIKWKTQCVARHGLFLQCRGRWQLGAKHPHHDLNGSPTPSPLLDAGYLALWILTLTQLERLAPFYRSGN